MCINLHEQWINGRDDAHRTSSSFELWFWSGRAPAPHILAISHPIWIIIWNWEFIGDSKRFSHNSGMGPKLNDRDERLNREPRHKLAAENPKLGPKYRQLALRYSNRRDMFLFRKVTVHLTRNIKDCDEKKKRVNWKQNKTHGRTSERKYDCSVGWTELLCNCKCRPIVPSSCNSGGSGDP